MAEFVETPSAEFVGIVDREGGDGVECTHRSGGVAAGDPVETFDQEVAATAVFFEHLLLIFRGGIDRGFCHELADEWRAETSLTEFHHVGANVGVAAYEGADADATFVISLRHGVDQHGILMHALDAHHRHHRLVGVAKFAIYFVAEEEEAMARGYVGDLLQFVAGVDVAGGVVGVADEDSLGAGCDESLELLDGRKPKTGLDGRIDRYDSGTGGDGECHIIGVGGLRHDDFIARVETCHKCEEHRFGASGGDDDFVGVDLQAAAMVIFRHLDAERFEALRGGIFEHLTVYVTQGVEGLRRGGNIGLADVETIYGDAALLGGVGSACKAPYGRGGHLDAAIGYFTFHQINSKFKDRALNFRNAL